MKLTRGVAVVAFGLTVGCAGARPAEPPIAGRSEAKRLQGQLRVTHVNLITQGVATRVQASVENTYRETVRGLRYVVTVYRERAVGNRLSAYQYEDDTVIQPGRRAAVAFDLPAVDLGGSGESRYTVAAAPKRVGDRAFPPPPGWKP